ncbi:MAG: hypothetical protein ACW981_15300 [Candidatus Hodarchaeales archaeon]
MIFSWSAGSPSPPEKMSFDITMKRRKPTLKEYITVILIPILILISYLSIINYFLPQNPIHQPENEWNYFHGEVYLFESRNSYDISLTINVTGGRPVFVIWSEGDVYANLLVFANRSRTVDYCYKNLDDIYWDENLPTACKNRIENHNYLSIKAYSVSFWGASKDDYERYNTTYVNETVPNDGYYKYVIKGGPFVSLGIAEWNSMSITIGIITLAIIAQKFRKK